MTSLLPSSKYMQEVVRLSPQLNKATASAIISQLHTCLAAIGSATLLAREAFAHVLLFLPTFSTVVTTLTKGFLPQLPGLTLATLCRSLPHLVATVKGHLDQMCNNLRSTKLPKLPSTPDRAEAHNHHTKCFAYSVVGSPTTHYCYAAVISSQSTGQVHLDQTSNFLIVLSTDNNYLLLVYDHDRNGILAKLTPKHTTLYILHAYRIIHTCLTSADLPPKLQQLDNEASLILKNYTIGTGLVYQLVPLCIHWHNATECATLTFKNHFIAGLCSSGKNFPLHLWDHLVP
jgi:hypothetical protein